MILDFITIIGVAILVGFITWLANREIIKSKEYIKKSDKALQANEHLFYTDNIVVNRAKISKLENEARFGELSKGIVHDMLSPLSSISMYINHISNSPKYNLVDNHQTKETLEMLNKTVLASQRMQSYMESVRHGLINKNTQDIIEKVNIVHEINTVKDLVAYKARMADVKINIEIIGDKVISHKSGDHMKGNTDSLFSIQTQSIYIHQVLLNLVSNSIEAFDDSPKEKIIIISLERTAISDKSKSVKKNDTILVRVTDNGRGITEEDKISLFSNHFSRKGSNRGIGLMTVKRIIEQELGGKISFESEVGIGSTFTVQIPLI